MDLYPFAKYAHFIAIVGTVAATTLLHLSVTRMRSATTIADARAAVATIGRVAPLMPLFALALLATGAYLVQLRWTMRYGFVVAGISGLVVLVGTSLVVHKPRLAKLAAKLKDASSLDEPLRAALSDRAVVAAMISNHVIALAVMFDMVVKPTLAGSLAVLLVAPAAGLLTWMMLASAPLPKTLSNDAA